MAMTIALGTDGHNTHIDSVKCGPEAVAGTVVGWLYQWMSAWTWLPAICHDDRSVFLGTGHGTVRPRNGERQRVKMPLSVWLDLTISKPWMFQLHEGGFLLVLPVSLQARFQSIVTKRILIYSSSCLVPTSILLAYP